MTKEHDTVLDRENLLYTKAALFLTPYIKTKIIWNLKI